jgi:hypothetical protein
VLDLVQANVAQILTKSRKIDFAAGRMRRLKMRLEQRRFVMIKDDLALLALEAKQALLVCDLLKELIVRSR